MAQPRFKVPWQYIEGLPPIAQDQIRRNFDEVGQGFAGLSTFPYTLVASDGTGNFTSIKAAIEAQPTGETFQRVIFVKPGTYTDTAAGTNIGSRAVHLIALQDGGRLIDFAGTIPQVLWNITSIVGTTDAFFAADGIAITSSTANAVLAPTASVSWNINFVNCVITAGTNAAVLSTNLNSSSRINFFRSTVNSLSGAGGGTVFPATITMAFSKVTCQSGATANIYTGDFYADQSDLSIGPSHFKGNSTQITNNNLSYSSPTFTTGVAGGVTSQMLHVAGNVERATAFNGTNVWTVNINLANNETTAVNFSDNNLAIKLLIVGTGIAQRTNKVYIDGCYAQLELNCDGCQVNVGLNLTTANNLTALVVAGTKNVINAVLENGTAANNQGYNFTGAANLANISQRGFAVASANPGASTITVV